MKLSTLNILAVVALALAAPAARAADVSHITLKDQSASAVFLSVDTNSCPQGVEYFVAVQGGLFVSKDNGTNTATPLMSVQINVWDNCQNARVLFAHGETTQFELEIDANLKKAKLKGTVPLYNDQTAGTIYADVDLAWTATSKLEVDAFNDTWQATGVAVAVHALGKTREALASGTVKIQGSPTDYTPEPSIVGYIQKNGSHEFTITRE
jgi:hypothetical protein